MKRWNRHSLRELVPQRREPEPDARHTFPALHWMTAGIFIAAGVEAAFGRRRGETPDDVRWAPLLVAPLAGVAQVVRAVAPTPATRLATQLLNGVAIGVGAIGVASSTWAVLEAGRDEGIFRPRRKPLFKRVPSLAPVTFGAAGVLGMLLDREERSDSLEHASLQRRARVVERLVPRPPRRRLERIVVHV
jgi:hypothetical protein